MVHEVIRGKAVLDIPGDHFLAVEKDGSLIGKEEDPETKYAVVSCDTDYHGIVGFWNRSWQTHNKVICIQSLNQKLPAREPASVSLPPQDDETEQIAIHEFIVRAFSKYGGIGSNGLPCMQVSMLCSILNSLPEYKRALKKYSLRPREYLITECSTFLMLQKEYMHDWAYLLAEKDTHQAEKPDRNIMEEEPDIMDMGDLSIDDDPEFNEPLMEEPMPDESVMEELGLTEETALPEATEEAGTDIPAAAEECFREADESVKNGLGHIRASYLRDELMQIPEFRILQKESGQKPIPFMQVHLAGRIRFIREKGIWWAAPVEKEPTEPQLDSALAEHRKKFYMEAFSNIQKRLTDAGIEKNTADEIAGIFMQSNTAVEPRKVMHNLLVQRYGTKIGSQYYRKAVKYTGI